MASTILNCPECGSKNFSWSIRRVQIGNIHEYDDGERREEVEKLGEGFDSDVNEKGVLCHRCEAHLQKSELTKPSTGGVK